MKTLSIIFCSFFVGHLACCQSPTLAKLGKDNELIYRKYALYPSTLRMINLQKNVTYNESIKDIEKVKVYRPNKKLFGQKQYDHLLNSLKQQEQYEEFITLIDTTQSLTVLGKKNRKQQTILMWFNKEEYYLTEIIGKINILKLIQFYQSVQSGEYPIGNEFVDVFQFLGLDSKGR